MFKAPVYKGMPNRVEFRKWAQECLRGGYTIRSDWHTWLEFELEEDLALYNITWFNDVWRHEIVEIAAFYCPYIPKDLQDD